MKPTDLPDFADVVDDASRLARARLQAGATRQLLEAVDHSDNAFIVGGPDACVTYVNRGFERMFGYAADEVAGRSLVGMLAGPHTDMTVMDSIQRDLMQPGGSRVDALLYTRSGQPKWVAIVANPIVEDDGQLSGVVGVLTDITDTKMHETLQHKVLDAMVHETPLLGLMDLVCREVERIAPEVTATILSVDADGLLHPLASPPGALGRNLTDHETPWLPACPSSGALSPDPASPESSR